MVGLGIFDLILDEDKIICPMCNYNFDSITCGFENCYFLICGIMIIDNNLKKRYQQKKWVFIKDFKYFDYKEEGNVVWKSLKFITKTDMEDQNLNSFDCCVFCKKENESNMKRIKRYENCEHIANLNCLKRFKEFKKEFWNKCFICNPE